MSGWTVAVLAGLALLLPPAAVAQTAARSPDSEAPRGAGPNWLPPEEWVAQHWLPYDERRLHRILGTDHAGLGAFLRDDRRTIAAIARRRGWDPAALARKLVAGRSPDRRRTRELERRALRTLTQGHLAQHVFFHPFHQDVIPRAAPAIFGVRSRAEFLALRRADLSPLQICRLYGVPRGQAHHRAADVLRATAARGVATGAMPAAQGRRLLRRQLRMLPLWLRHTRYFGRPPVADPRVYPAGATTYSSDAGISGDGRVVAYEAYAAGTRNRLLRGGVAVTVRDGDADPRRASGAPGVAQTTAAPAVSRDGRWVAFEVAEHARRRIEVSDLARRRTVAVSHVPGARLAEQAYAPAISADGAVIAFEAHERPAPRADGTEIAVRDQRSGRAWIISPRALGARDLQEPALSADGERLAFTAVAEGAGGVRSTVMVRDLSTGATRRVSRTSEQGWAPSISAGGDVVAYTASAPGAASRIVVADRDRHHVVPAPSGALASDPSLSASGTRVAFVARAPGVLATQVHVHDRAARTTELVSRASGPAGAAAMGTAALPAISADGRQVAFTSDAWNLAPGKCNGARGIFRRDMARHTTTLVSTGDGAVRAALPTRGGPAGADAFAALACRWPARRVSGGS